MFSYTEEEIAQRMAGACQKEKKKKSLQGSRVGKFDLLHKTREIQASK